MKITGYEIGRLRVPLRAPFKTALRTVNSVDDVVLLLETNVACRGFGSAPATAAITGETHESITTAICNAILPAVIGEPVADLNRIVARIHQSVAANSSAKAAVEMAVYDLFAQHLGVPLYQALGGGDPVLNTDITISVNNIGTMVHDAMEAARQGFDVLKVKLGKDPGFDVDRVRAIDAAVGAATAIGLDANQGWTAEQAVATLQKLENAGIELAFVEQPVPAKDIEGLRYIRERVVTPVMADESAFGPKDVLKLGQAGAADIINIKLMKCAGISNARRIADIASIHDMTCMMGCMLESAIGVAAAAHVAAANPGTVTYVDLDAASLATMNPLQGGVSFAGPEIRLSDAPGLGIKDVQGISFLSKRERTEI